MAAHRREYHDASPVKKIEIEISSEIQMLSLMGGLARGPGAADERAERSKRISALRAERNRLRHNMFVHMVALAAFGNYCW
jgi:hypothetical protein